MRYHGVSPHHRHHPIVASVGHYRQRIPPIDWPTPRRTMTVIIAHYFYCFYISLHSYMYNNNLKLFVNTQFKYSLWLFYYIPYLSFLWRNILSFVLPPNLCYNIIYFNFKSEISFLYVAVHGSAASLLSGGSSLYGSAEERQANEVRRLKRELGDARDQVMSLSSQLSTNVSTFCYYLCVAISL